MSDLKERLQKVLGSAYHLERELGGGGMSRVFVATETELGRKVVVKVLPPEMGAGVNAQRFRREIQLAASLQHPHIVPLLHAGRQDDLLYYTMPLVEGESLRAKLAREGELPIGEAVRILRDVVDALAYAHAHGVVHRDIKPDNVLISGHHAVVTDFGVAKALSEATGEQSLTSIGVALGTPAYMAPEQAAAEPNVDHRADLYALGALAYEVLAGRPPFVGANAQQVLAAHVTQAPDPISKHRASVPPALAALVMRCLEKKPADRWQHATEVHMQLESMATPSGGTTPTTAVPAARPRVPTRRVAIAAAGGAALLAAVAVTLLRGGGGPGIDANMVVVMPFRVAGADPALHYLREGMIDLLAAKLTGEGGPRAADPRTVTSAFRRAAGSDQQDLSQAQAVDVARGIGAGQVLLGGIVGSPAHVTLSATVVAVPGGAQRAQASVEGPADSLPALLDRLASQLLIRGAALGSGGEASLTTRSLPALQAYLAGQQVYRRGDYDGAATHFARAVGHDSSFTLATFALVLTNGWGVPVPGIARIRQLTWDGRDRLSKRDRAVFEAYVGMDFPVPPLYAAELAGRERVVEQYGDLADAWYFLGDVYFHYGRLIGHQDWKERAKAAFDRAVALDSSFTAPVSHLINLAALTGDSAAARRYGRIYLDHAAGSSRFDHVVRFDLARTLRDPGAMRDFWTTYDTAANRAPYLAEFALETGAPPSTVDSVIAILGRRADSELARATYHASRARLALNTGRPRAALAHHDSATGSHPDAMDYHAPRLLFALYWDADSGVGAAAARRLSQFKGSRSDELQAACLLELWRLSRGDAATTSRTVTRLRSSLKGDAAVMTRRAAMCASVVEATAATLARGPDALRLVERADSVMRQGPGNSSVVVPYENLVIGRLFAALGNPARGLAAVRRGGDFNADIMVSTYLREQGRLAALTGDRDEAIRAYSRYLELRANPEPGVQPAVNEVRAELARLVGERPQR